MNSLILISPAPGSGFQPILLGKIKNRSISVLLLRVLSSLASLASLAGEEARTIKKGFL
ncbi:hypothetical protein [Microcoleus sp. CAWBG58]|uniref:hypothetical protein n=1 Tax=Microcoleus sp. CAWBG58 TaxID=2841651 RepID=UPI0025FBFC23|nr:hypothetical protein [Microcoleus sp. CAWBG58]